MRASRLVELLGLLQARGRMTAAQLAAELEVSQRTILRDIEALNSAGFPVYATRGSLGGFELLAGFTSDLPLAPRRPGPAARPVQRARIRLSPRGRRLARLTGRPANLRVRRSTGHAAGRDDWVEAWVPVGSEDSVVSDILALGGEAEVIHSPELRGRVRAMAEQIADLHAGAPPPRAAG